jgi:hypothetical protein
MDPNDKPPAGRRIIIAGKLDSLLAASSLGTPGALALRAAADPDQVEKILARVDELDAAEPSLAEVDPELATELDAMDDEYLADLERELAATERHAMAATEAHKWWRRSREAWGRLQQVRKGTRVCCPFCSGARVGCPMCERGFVDRDEAIDHYEMDMEFAGK